VTTNALTLVVCGAPLASRTRDVRAALAAAGWAVSLLPSDAAAAWAEAGDPDRARPVAVVACPLTFNTANKLVTGIMDTPVAGALCDAVGAHLPVVAVPMVNNRLWSHPTWARTLATLREWAVVLVDPADGRVGEPRPVASGTGDAVATAFDPQWITAALGPAPSCG
jgi:Flavoprotein